MPVDSRRGRGSVERFLDDGIADVGYREILPAGSPFPTSITWWETEAKQQKIAEQTITRNAFQMPTQVVTNLYGSDGVTVYRTVTDVIGYANNVFENTRTRSVS